MASKTSILSRVGKAVSRLFGSVFGSKEEADRRHEREMAHLDALKSGKVTPTYALRYAGVGVFVILSGFIIVDAAWPGLLPGSPVEALEHLGELGVNMLKAVFGM